MVRLKVIAAMLDRCADGWTAKETNHKWWVTFKRRTYRRLPLGPHGARDNPEVKIGYAKHMARFFELDSQCVEAGIPQLRGQL